jgi:hypothetical protein
MTRTMFGRLVLASIVLLLFGCSDNGPYLDISGGGFIFNYRVSEAYAGFIAAPLRTLPEHSRIEATFEDPAGGTPIVLTMDVVPARKEYSFSTPPLSGIKANTDYGVTIRLLAADGTEIEKIDKKFRSDVDESVLADKPLTVGPGYTKNPALNQNSQ